MTKTNTNGNSNTFRISLANFSFPPGLSGGQANFRFIVDLRYIDAGGEFATEHAVMPSLDTFWECDPNKKDKPNFVRAGDSAKFDMKKIDDWDRLVLCVKARELHSVQAKVIDVDRKDIFDKLKELAQGVLKGAFGVFRSRVASLVPSSAGALDAPTSVHQTLGNAADDIESLLLKKMAGGDKVLFRGSVSLKKEELKKKEMKDGKVAVSISGVGTTDRDKDDHRVYTIGLTVGAASDS